MSVDPVLVAGSHGLVVPRASLVVLLVSPVKLQHDIVLPFEAKEHVPAATSVSTSQS